MDQAPPTGRPSAIFPRSPARRGAIARCALLIAVLLLALPLAGATTGDSGVTGSSLTGQLLVAAPEMGDPRFAEAVILVVQHDQAGAVGIIINKPAGKISFAQLLTAIGQPGAPQSGTLAIFAGGPVELSAGFVIHSLDYRRPETEDIDGLVALTTSASILRDIAEGKGPKKSLVAFGYAGWGPGQLENELMRHDWFTLPEEPALVFDIERSRVWKEAMARRSQAL
jgi:putative transcriptional regulator